MVYEEHQSFVAMYVMAGAVLIALVLTAFFAGADLRVISPSDRNGMLIAAAAILVVLWGFSRLNVIVTTTEFRFGFPAWHRCVPLSSIEVGDTVPIRLWYGLGIHYAGGMWVYNARLGRGVMVTIKGTRHLIGSNDPERLQAALLQVAPRRSGA